MLCRLVLTLCCVQAPISGDNFERGGCSGANSGLFTAFLEQDDVKMVNVGHDHVNDYCTNWKGIDLCYGGGCGFGAGAYGKTGWARRARVIELGQDPITKEVTNTEAENNNVNAVSTGTDTESSVNTDADADVDNSLKVLSTEYHAGATGHNLSTEYHAGATGHNRVLEAFGLLHGWSYDERSRTNLAGAPCS